MVFEIFHRIKITVATAIRSVSHFPTSRLGFLKWDFAFRAMYEIVEN